MHTAHYYGGSNSHWNPYLRGTYLRGTEEATRHTGNVAYAVADVAPGREGDVPFPKAFFMNASCGFGFDIDNNNNVVGREFAF